MEKMKGKNIRLQVDGATDSNRDANLVWYARFMDGDKIVEDLLF
jgi:hypothetical protein